MKRKLNRIFFYFFILFFIAELLFISSAFSLESYGTFKQNSEIRITQVCSDATYVTITSISYPNSSIAISNINMSYSDGEYYYIFNKTNELGRYDLRFISDGCEKTAASYFYITKDGTENNFLKSDLQFFIFFFVSLIFGTGLGLIGYYKDNKLLILASIGFFSAGILSNFYQQNTILFFPTEAVSLLNYGLGMLCLAFGIYAWLPDD